MEGSHALAPGLGPTRSARRRGKAPAWPSQSPDPNLLPLLGSAKFAHPEEGGCRTAVSTPLLRCHHRFLLARLQPHPKPNLTLPDQQGQGRVRCGSDSATHTLPPLLPRRLLRGPLAKIGPPEAPPGCARAEQLRRSRVPVDAYGDSATADLRIVHGLYRCLRILLGRVAHCAETPAHCVHGFRVEGMT